MRAMGLRWWGWPDKIGIRFRYRGDYLWWRWPWKRGGRWLSLLASGTGEFGDATFRSLEQVDAFWDAMAEIGKPR